MTARTDTQQRIPLVVGVTGHRDLRPQDEAALREQVIGFFAELKFSLPYTPLCLLSSLADGADRLVAEVALEQDVDLLVPLPADQSLYEATFFSSDSIAPFRALLARAAGVWVIPECQTPADAPRLAVEDWQYARAGAYLVRQSHILLALWDGRNSDLPGGTAAVVHFALEGIPQNLASPVSLLAAPHTAQVVQIATPRLSHSPDKTPRISRQVVWPAPVEQEMETPWKGAAGKAESRLNEFNRDAARYQAALAECRQQSRRYLLPDEIVTSLSRTERQLLEVYASTDALALKFQQRLLRRLWLSTFLALLAVVLLQLYFTFLSQPPALMAGYVGAAFAAFAVYYLTTWQQFESKYLDYRALAEGLRVQLFWRMAGLEDSVADYYLSRQQGELSWIREALRSRLLLLFHQPAVSHEVDRQFALVEQHWVVDQLNYFQRATRVLARRHFRLSTLAKVLAVAGLAIAVVKTLAWKHLSLEISVILLPVLAAMLMVYIRTRKFREQSRQFARMAVLYRRAAAQLKQALARGDARTTQSILFELGQEALIENGDWVILHRDRPLEGPNVV